MNKRYLHHLWTRIRPIRTRYLVVAFLISATVAVVALRNNYTTMVTLREEVYSADREGEGVEAALQALRAHVNGHMNTSLSSGPEGVYPPIQLKETYQRLVDAEQRRFEAANAQLYTEAQNHCEASNPDSFSGRSRVPCIQQYVKDHGKSPREIPDAVYKFDFASPSWSPDLAGWSVVVSTILLVLAAVRFALGKWFKRN